MHIMLCTSDNGVAARGGDHESRLRPSALFRARKYEAGKTPAHEIPQASAGVGFVSAHVFGEHANQHSTEKTSNPARGNCFRMVAIKTMHVEALQSSTGLLMVSPFLPKQLKKCIWKMSEFMILKCIYNTTYSQVLHVKHPASGTQFAIKRYTKDSLTDDQMIQAVREIWFHSRLSHPCIIAMHAAWSEEGKICMALEYAPCGSAFRTLRAVGRFEEPECVARIIFTTLCAVDFLHGIGLIHRDIKPENILLTKDGSKLADLGLVINHRTEAANTCLGTFDYMAPELFDLPRKAHPLQFKDDEDVMTCNEKVDVWAVGVLAYELLIGRAPFTRKTSAATVEQIVNGFNGHFPTTVNVHVSAPAKDFVKLCLRHRPQTRPSIKQLLEHDWIKCHRSHAVDAAQELGGASHELISAGEGAWSEVLEAVDSDTALRIKQRLP